MVFKVKLLLSLSFILLSGSKLVSQKRHFEVQKTFDAPNARQGVAVDDNNINATVNL